MLPITPSAPQAAPRQAIYNFVLKPRNNEFKAAQLVINYEGKLQVSRLSVRTTNHREQKFDERPYIDLLKTMRANLRADLASEIKTLSELFPKELSLTTAQGRAAYYQLQLLRSAYINAALQEIALQSTRIAYSKEINNV